MSNVQWRNLQLMRLEVWNDKSVLELQSNLCNPAGDPAVSVPAAMAAHQHHQSHTWFQLRHVIGAVEFLNGDSHHGNGTDNVEHTTITVLHTSAGGLYTTQHSTLGLGLVLSTNQPNSRLIHNGVQYTAMLCVSLRETSTRQHNQSTLSSPHNTYTHKTQLKWQTCQVSLIWSKSHSFYWYT